MQENKTSPHSLQACILGWRATYKWINKRPCINMAVSALEENTVECIGLGCCGKCGHLTSLWQGDLRPEEWGCWPWKDLNERAPSEGITVQKFWGRNVLGSSQEKEEEECHCRKRMWVEGLGKQEQVREQWGAGYSVLSKSMSSARLLGVYSEWAGKLPRDSQQESR